MTNPADLQRLLAEEPFVRALARSLCADEADDVVQQAWLRALERQPGALRQPRQWLARIVRNLATDVRRRRQRRAARHAVLGDPAPVPSSAQLLEGEERRAELVAAVDALPDHLRAVVLLRYYEGLPPRRIAAQLGLPVQRVWNQLHTALQALRDQLDARHGGDRRAWLLPLVPFATAPRALPWREVLGNPLATTTVLGVIAMTTKTKLTVAAAMLAVAVAWIAWPSDGSPGTLPPGDVASRGPEVARGDLSQTPEATAPADAPQRAAVSAGPTAPTTGTLLVHVRYADEPQVAAGLTVVLGRRGGDFRVGVRRAATDAAGTARFDGIGPGVWRAHATTRPTLPVDVEVQAGATTESSLRLRGGMTLTGVVVDAAGVPVGGALVESLMGGWGGIDADQVAVTAADGTFTVRECDPICLVGARAAGFAPSQLYSRVNSPGAREHVRIELVAAGGSVEGLVVGPGGDPVAGAVVRVGDGRTDFLMMTTRQGAAPLPAQVRTDEHGRFLAVGVPAGTLPIMARADGLLPWSGTCDVAAGSSVPVRIVLSPGVVCTGIVRSDIGDPVPDAEVSVGQRGDFVQFRTRTAADGTFALRGLPVGDVDVHATKQGLGKATVRVRGEVGTALRCELTLSHGLALRGRIVDEAGAPVPTARVDARAEDAGATWQYSDWTNREGRFLLADCPVGQLLTVDVAAAGHLVLRKRGIDPRTGDIELRLQRDTTPRARIVGSLLGPDGRGAVGVAVEAWRLDPQEHASAVVKDPGGSFAIEVASASWSIRIQSSGHPDIRFDARSLEAGAVWDLGTLQLVRGGTLVVHGTGTTKLDYLVVDAREQFVCGLWSPVPPLRSDLIAPGDHLLLVRAEGIAALALPFTIRADEETTLEVSTTPGVRQRLEFAPPPGDETTRHVPFELRRDGKLLLWDSARGAAPFTCDVHLAPGSYTLTTRKRDPATRAQFTIGNDPGPPLRVPLR